MRGNRNLEDVQLDWDELTKAIRLDIDQAKARVLGVSSEDLANAINTALSGMTATTYREDDKLIDVLIRGSDVERQQLSFLKDLAIPTRSGKSVALSQIADIRYGLEEGIIWRRDRLPTITVRAHVYGDMQAPAVTAQLAPAIDAIRAKLPPGYRLEIGGAAEESAKGGGSVAAGVPLFVVTVVTILMIQLQSFARTTLVLLTAPLGMIGVTASLLLFGMPFGFVAMLGTIALFGHDHAQLGDPRRPDRAGHRGRVGALERHHRRHGAPLPADHADRRGGDPGHGAAVAQRVLRSYGGGYHGRLAGGDSADPAVPAGALCGVVPCAPAGRGRVRGATLTRLKCRPFPGRRPIEPSP